MRLIIFVTLLFSSFQLLAQDENLHTSNKKAAKAYQNAVQSYRMRANDRAMTLSREALDQDPDFVEPHLLLASIFEDENQLDSAIHHYRLVAEAYPTEYTGTLFSLCKLEIKAEQFLEALKHLNKFIELNSSPVLMKEAEGMKPGLEYAADAYRHPVPFKPVHMSNAINSTMDEYCPTMTVDERYMLFTRLVLPEHQEDIYISRKGSNGWEDARNIGSPVNTPYNEGAVCVSNDGKYLFYTACNLPEGKGSCDIYMARFENGRWSESENLGAPVNTMSFESQPSFSSDGKTLYFTSGRVGGLGGYDIWKSTMDSDGHFGNPVNLGPNINTAKSENSPFIHPDNQTLYFTTNGRPGMGSQDFYLSRRKLDGSWDVPMNLGYPINTVEEERSLSVGPDGRTAFFASSKFKESTGRMDIYSFDLYTEAQALPVSYLKGVIKDDKTKLPLEASFEVIDVATGQALVSKSDSRSGEFLLCLPIGHKYALNASKEGYLFYSDAFDLLKSSNKEAFQKDIFLKPIQEGQSIVLKNVFFNTDSYALLPESKAELDKLNQFLKTNPKVTIEIGGHTDNTGNLLANQTLSDNRAKSVKEYLISIGVNAAQLSHKGYAANKPIADNATEEGKAQNRRTEFKILTVK